MHPPPLTSLGQFYPYDGMYARKQPLQLCVLCGCGKIELVGLSPPLKKIKYINKRTSGEFLLPDRISGFFDHGQVLFLKNDSRLSYLIERIKNKGNFYLRFFFYRLSDAKKLKRINFSTGFIIKPMKNIKKLKFFDT